LTWRGRVLLNLLEIDSPLLHIRADKLHLEPVADIDAFNPIERPASKRGLKDADPCPFVGRALADGLKPVSDPFQKYPIFGGRILSIRLE